MAMRSNHDHTDQTVYIFAQEDWDIYCPLSVASMTFEGSSLCYKLKQSTSLFIHYVKAVISMAPLEFGKKALKLFIIMLLTLPCHGRRDYRASDLRDKLERRRSPPRSYSSVRGSRGRYASNGYSSSRSGENRSDRKHRKKHHLDGEGDFSETLKVSDGTSEGVRNKRLRSSDSKGVLEEQLRQVQSDIDMMDDHKCQLEIHLEERAQEADSLTSQLQELERQLFQENEECKRITAKIKKFIRAHNRCSRIQDELNRSQARLQKLGDQLGSESARADAGEEDPGIDILSEGETIGNHVGSTQNELQKNAAPIKKRFRNNVETPEELKPETLSKGEGTLRLERLSRWNAQRAQSNNKKNVLLDGSGNDRYEPLANEDKSKRGKTTSANGPSAVKLMGPSESGFVLPSTSMAAHAMDEIVDVIEVEEKLEAVQTSSATRVDMGSTYEAEAMLPPPPPPPPIPLNAYLEYAGNAKNVNAKALEEEMVDVEIV